MSRVDLGIVIQRENFFRNRFYYLGEIGWRVCSARPAGEKSVTREQMATRNKTQAARRMTGGV